MGEKNEVFEDGDVDGLDEGEEGTEYEAADEECTLADEGVPLRLTGSIAYELEAIELTEDWAVSGAAAGDATFLYDACWEIPDIPEEEDSSESLEGSLVVLVLVCGGIGCRGGTASLLSSISSSLRMAELKLESSSSAGTGDRESS